MFIIHYFIHLFINLLLLFSFFLTGSMYVYHLTLDDLPSDQIFYESQKLVPSEQELGNSYGFDFAVFLNTLVVGAPGNAITDGMYM
jgi:hypothetical protein